MDTRPIRILRRPTQQADAPTTKDAQCAVPSKTLEQREADYAAARRRIMGSESEETSEVPEDDSAATTNTTLSATATKTVTTAAATIMTMGIKPVVTATTVTSFTPTDMPTDSRQQLHQNPKKPSSCPTLSPAVKPPPPPALPAAIPLMSIPTAALPIPSSLDCNPRSYFQQGLPNATTAIPAVQKQPQASRNSLPSYAYRQRQQQVQSNIFGPPPFPHQPAQTFSETLAHSYASAPQLFDLSGATYVNPSHTQSMMQQQQVQPTQEQLLQQHYQTLAAVAAVGAFASPPSVTMQPPQSAGQPSSAQQQQQRLLSQQVPTHHHQYPPPPPPQPGVYQNGLSQFYPPTSRYSDYH